MIINRMHKFILLLVLGIDIEKVKVVLWDLKATLIFPFFKVISLFISINSKNLLV